MTALTRADLSRCTATSRRRPSLRSLIALSRQRRRLAQLDARALDDIGLTRAEALDEARRPPWDAPDHWRC
jgi:uncharacterized protein YjiS (DUF1127 family)